MFKPLAALKALYLNAHGVDADKAPSLLTDAQWAHNQGVYAARIGDAPTGEAICSGTHFGVKCTYRASQCLVVRPDVSPAPWLAQYDRNETAARLLAQRMMGVDL